MRGLFIAVEGIDGCGKSTFVRGVAQALRLSGRDVVVTAEPTKTWLGKAVRKSWDERCGPAIEAYLFMADRAEHCKIIEVALARGQTVLCDRYQDSTLAYQGSALGRSHPRGLRGALEWLRSMSPPGLLVPDLTFYLKLAPEEAMRRMSGRTTRSKFEHLAYLKRVAGAYSVLEREGRFITLDSTAKRLELVSHAMRAVNGVKPGLLSPRHGAGH